MKTSLKLIITLTACGGVLAAAPAYANDFEFSYRAFELDNPTLRSELLDRLERRVERYCRARARTVIHIRAANECAEEMFVDVVDQIDDPRLTRESRLARSG